MAKKRAKPLTGNHGDFSGIVLKAAARGDSQAVREYLRVNPAWLNQVGPHGRTLLWEAAYKGRNELVGELIALGADVNPMGSYYTPMLVELSALAVARSKGNSDLVAMLEAAGASDDLYAACHRGDLEAINQFLTVDPEAVHRPSRDDEPHPRMGFHPVHYAVVGGQLGALRLLVGYGAEVSDHLPLLVDWANGNRDLIRFLREQAALQGGRPVRKPSNPKPTKSSVRKKASARVPAIDRPDWMGFPLLVDACRGNHNAPDEPARVKRLLAKGANVNVTDHKGKTPLHRASQAGFIKITKLLLSNGAELEIADEKGGTPIFDAAHHGRKATLRLLIEHGANIHHIDVRDETPLFAAGRGGRGETFRALLDAGADARHRNKRGKTVEEVVAAARTMTDERREILKLIRSI